MRSYRAVVTTTATTVSVTAEIQAWNTDHDDWSWITIQHWNLHSSAKGPDLKTALADSLVHHGWLSHDLTGLNLRTTPAVCTIAPTNWTELLTRLTRERDEAAARLADLDHALRSVVADATDTGDVTTLKAAGIVGVSRGRIYQLRTDTTASMARARKAGADVDPDRLTTSERSSVAPD